MIISKITKKLFCIACILALSTSAAFASSVPSNEDVIKCKDITRAEMSVRVASTPISSHGGHGEYGWGMFNAWAKYAHDDNIHQVVLQTDNTYSEGAWELAGGNNYSYVESKKGKSTNYAYGNIK